MTRSLGKKVAEAGSVIARCSHANESSWLASDPVLEHWPNCLELRSTCGHARNPGRWDTAARGVARALISRLPRRVRGHRFQVSRQTTVTFSAREPSTSAEPLIVVQRDPRQPSLQTGVVLKVGRQPRKAAVL